MPLIEATGIWKEFAQPGHKVVALRDVNLEIERGEFVVITGESGSGKSTLLSVLGALDRLTRGTIRFLGEFLDSAPPGRLAWIRRNHIGFLFQDFRLVRHLSAIDNVRLPLLFARPSVGGNIVRELVERFHVEHRLRHRPGALSRGEMQRIALARALVNRPDVLLADEPTANLDRRNSETIWNYLKDLNRSERLTVVVATHNLEFARQASRVLRLDDGRMVSDAACG